MSGICGWIGTHHGPTAAAQALRGMAGGLPHAGIGRTEMAAEPGGALCLHGADRDAHWHTERGVHAAIVGYPAWSDADLANAAARSGHAAALVIAYRQHGSELLARLRGAFALAVVDSTRGEGLLAIDRIGIEPLALSILPSGAILFGSTTDAVRRHAAASATVSPQSVFDFFYFVDRIPAPSTIYVEQQKLLPGELIELRRGRVARRRYWRMPYQATSRATSAELQGELIERLRAAVKTSIADEDLARTGAFLSGGLDSSSVVGMLTEIGGGPVRAFSIGFEAEGYDELDYARIAARHYKARHVEYYVTPGDVLSAIEKIATEYDEPFANSSAVPVYYCARLARDNGVDLMLAGDGGDELFAGNTRYTKDRIFDAYGAIPAPLRRGAVEPLVRALPSSSWLGRKARNYVARALMSVPERWSQDNLYATVPAGDVFEPSFLASVDPASPARLMAEMYSDGVAATPLQRMLQLDLRLTLADGDIRKVNRMCRLAGVRVRYPFLDHDLAEFSARVPPALLIAGGRLRDFYKKAARTLLPAEIVEKRKHGFGLPYISFVARHAPLRELAYDTLSAFKRRGIMKPAFIDRSIALHAAGSADGVASAVWDMMVLELWLRRHVDGAALPAVREA